MKYLVILGDGMADEPVVELNGMTPLEAAHIPNMDYLAAHGDTGMAKTIPDGMAPGSEIANLSMMGYDPALYFTGRSPLEAVSIGIKLEDDDVAMRCNLVTISDTECFEDAVMKDHSAGDISTGEAKALIECVNQRLLNGDMHVYPGFSYRHCLILKHTGLGNELVPPHDILDRPIREYLPKGRHAELLCSLMERSYYILRDHPVNRTRRACGKNIASCCWIWGEGTKPALKPFEELHGIKGGVISAVDLVKGIGLLAGLQSVDVDGATGTLDTNYEGKAQAALDLLSGGCDFVYIHVEGPDECGHHGDANGKVTAIERIDKRILNPVIKELDRWGEPYAILLAPDHPTPINLRTHTPKPIPFTIYRSGTPGTRPAKSFSEAAAARTGLYVAEGHTLITLFLER